ncbi:hypothetical protein Q5H92_12260 [Hymenobacter sp. M29]|uniref:Uncharacterized protein n=1 Tax=Hymenobacter mellowenesis TaxID=3063995 RepID=A0ABT9ABB2_9BACT|nr:hypothetical protein [Hymenobacter sp. M29]MDO7847137.1 hypothetical protein [Hymenobacter sp. M29]
MAYGNYNDEFAGILAAQLNLHFMKIPLVIWLLLCSIAPAFCQASWTFRLGFVLTDKQGQSLSVEDISSGKYQVFIGGGGTTSDREGLFYAEGLSLFYAIGSSTWPGVSIGLVNGQDSTIVETPIGSERLVLMNWPTEPGIYSLNEQDLADVNKSKSILLYPTKFHQGNRALFSLTVLNWNTFRSTHDVDRLTWKKAFMHSNKALKPHR